MNAYLAFKLGIAIGLFIAALVVYLHNRNPQRKKSRRKEWRFKWNTVLDEHTCMACSEMHGRILTKKELRKTHPPLHGRDKDNIACRCYLTLAK